MRNERSGGAVTSLSPYPMLGLREVPTAVVVPSVVPITDEPFDAVVIAVAGDPAPVAFPLVGRLAVAGGSFRISRVSIVIQNGAATVFGL